MLNNAARHGFWQLGPAMLVKIGKELMQLKVIGTTWEMAFMLIKEVLGCSDKDACGYLMHRTETHVAMSDALEEVLQSDIVGDVLSFDDQKATRVPLYLH